ncbi:DnaB-like helicase C-terminal domain-containing protein [Tepidibacter hydrothermalis]|uniref:DnaB-like helicase C-terminal domain-containing protein n=1 Tax=Tepidibacter hydrothermalis TaxID=3036126 RepID=A0ABY8EK07_9FIRM|nr:DnaB-like helicase C-terminal domain-containing protein [Tepidibacter hydrothermalis]WFD11368.1 DnaB-like helicase C-terminal domain-containing protein [Tepidibacter hydrothermalis]
MARRSKNSCEKVNAYLDEILNNTNEYRGRLKVSTGIDNIDRLIGGGITSQLYVVGAMPSFGKTDFLNQVGDNICSQGHDVLFFSYQMKQRELIDRTLCRKLFLLNSRRYKKMNSFDMIYDEVDKESLGIVVDRYKEEVSQRMNIIECDTKFSIKHIKDKIENHIKTKKTKPIVIIDYIQAIKSSDIKITDREKNDYNLSQLRDIVKNFDIAMICISSQSRGSYFKQGSYESFKDIYDIEDIADVVGYLQFKNISEQLKNGTDIEKIRKSYDFKNQYPRKIEFVLLKNRNGLDYKIENLYYYHKNSYFCSERIKESM